MDKNASDIKKPTCLNISIAYGKEVWTLVAAELLLDFADIFADILGCFGAIKHKIDTQGTHPVRQQMRRTPLGFENEEKQHQENMLTAGVIKPSTSAWASARVLVRKKDGGVCWCVDFRAVNQVTRKDSYPLPLIVMYRCTCWSRVCKHS